MNMGVTVSYYFKAYTLLQYSTDNPLFEVMRVCTDERRQISKQVNLCGNQQVIIGE
jgi:hypothetical protein